MDHTRVVSFKRRDMVRDELEEAVLELAECFKTKRPFLPDFCSMLRTSKRWNMLNINVSLGRWEEKFKRISGTNKTVELVKDAFMQCATDEEIHQLRGLMVEALVIGKYGGANCINEASYGWGANVEISQNAGEPPKTIKYVCVAEPKPHEDCGNRETVDFGYWNGYHGKFFECKVQPVNIRCKEINFMETLLEELRARKISHELFFMCANSCEAVKAILQEHNLCTTIFKPVGYDNLYSV